MIKSINIKSYDTGAIPGKGGFMYKVEYFGKPSYRVYQNDYQGSLYNLEGNKEDEVLFQKENQKYHISIWEYTGCNAFALHYTDGQFRLNTVTLT